MTKYFCDVCGVDVTRTPVFRSGIWMSEGRAAMKNLAELVGKRILYNLKWDDNDRYVYETVVRCLSPSGKYVDLGHLWYRCEDINVLEVLGDAKEGGDEKTNNKNTKSRQGRILGRARM